MKWERVPSEREKTCHSKAWFTVKKDTVHIKTKTFSFWSVFCCGGPKRKRATVFVSKPNPRRNLLHLRFYIYSDNEDSRKVWLGVIVRSVYHIQRKTSLDSVRTPNNSAKFHLNRDGLYQKRMERNGLQGAGLAQLVSAQPSVREVPSLIPRCDLSDLKSFFRLLSFRVVLSSFKYP